MKYLIKEHILKLHLGLIEKLNENYQVERLGSFIHIISPKKADVELKIRKRTALTLMAATHGDESVGVNIINHFLFCLLQRKVKLLFPLGVALGNPEAFRLDKRFIAKDLNRSFDAKRKKTYEEQRAHELSVLLEESSWFIDFHQTIMPSLEPFFIFPFTSRGLQFAQSINSKLSVVTHWGKNFSADGCCSDHFVNKSGGVGISIETGQKGFDHRQINLGSMVIIGALNFIEQHLQRRLDKQTYDNGFDNKIYTWADVVSYPVSGSVHLDPSWENFMPVKVGQKMGMHDDNSLVASCSGKILFPKYLDKRAKLKKRPSELYRIVKEITRADLPIDLC